jgi:hypothetical protein
MKRISDALTESQTKKSELQTHTIPRVGHQPLHRNEFERLHKLFLEEHLRMSLKGGYDITYHLLHCCAAGDIDMASFLVEFASVDVNEPLSKDMGQFQKGDTPISIAEKFENISIVQYLKAQFNRSEKEKKTSAFPERCHKTLWSEVCAKGPSYTPELHLIECCMSGDLSMVKFLVEEVGVDLTFGHEMKKGELKRADVSGWDRVREELEARWNRSKDEKPTVITALDVARINRHPRIVDYIRAVLAEKNEDRDGGNVSGRGGNMSGSEKDRKKKKFAESLFEFTSNFSEADRKVFFFFSLSI